MLLSTAFHYLFNVNGIIICQKLHTYFNIIKWGLKMFSIFVFSNHLKINKEMNININF